MKGKEEKSRDILIHELTERSVADIINKNDFMKTIKSGGKLRVKLGIDPTSPELHLGHMVLLRKLNVFQRLGHTVVFIIGDFTGAIGDPSGRDKTRPMLSGKEIKQNMKRYREQAGKIIDMKRCEIRYNSEWFGKKAFSFFSDLFSQFTVQQVLERDDFQKRMADGMDISMLEILYSVFQGYDSVAVRSDVEIGGTDQTFNLLMGRKVQRKFSMKEQDIITCELLVGTDGIKKMSKSFGNSINFSDAPKDVFGKVMSVPDRLLSSYYQLVDEPFESGVPAIDTKKRLAFLLVEMLYGAKKAEEARVYFEETFQKRKLPQSEKRIRAHSLRDVVGGADISQTELRRLVKQGAVEFNGKQITTPSFIFTEDGTLRVGKKKFFTIQKK